MNAELRTSVFKIATVPLRSIILPEMMKGRKKPQDVYKKAPITGPTVIPKLKKASHQALIVDLRPGNLAIRMARIEVHVMALPTP